VSALPTMPSDLREIVYTSEQDLLAKVDQLEERIDHLRIALTQIALVNRFETMATVRQFAKDILKVDDETAALDADFAEERELTSPIARVRAAVVLAQIQTGVSLARGPMRQDALGKLTDNPAHVVAATPMGLILQVCDPSLRGPPIVRAAAQACILIDSARAIDAGFRGEPSPVGGVEAWHALGVSLAAECGLPPVAAEEG
jgi:hypothetical protein